MKMGNRAISTAIDLSGLGWMRFLRMMTNLSSDV